jgi:cyclopropane fatty-acyl-phospholipid synthase-like methyltransferase
MRHALSLSVSLLLAACACPPPAAPAKAARPAPVAGAAHGQHHGDHQGGPLVRRFDEGGEHWRARFEGPDRDAYQKPAAVVAAMKLSPGMVVADIGTGSGYFLGHLSPAVGADGRVLALDIEPEMIRFVKARARKEGWSNVEARLVLPDDPLLAPESCDRILIVNTWHHIGGRERYAKELHAALRPGGEVWVVDFTMQTERGPAREHRVLPATVEQELRGAGLGTRVDTALLGDQFVVIGARSS